MVSTSLSSIHRLKILQLLLVTILVYNMKYMFFQHQCPYFYSQF